MTSFRVLTLAAISSAALTASADAATQLVVRGAGFGHGVGMSQYGAHGMAKRGLGYQQILGHYYSGTVVSQGDAGQTVRVLLQSSFGAVRFKGATRAGDERLDPGTTYSARAGGRGVRISDGSKVVADLAGPADVTAAAPITVLGPSAGITNGSYRGTLRLVPDGGSLLAVNALPMEQYLRGVVPGEVPASWPAEALKTQAVAARTYALTTARKGGAFDQFADTRSQVYHGVKAEQPTTDAAIAATRAQIVTRDGQPVTTFYFSTSGGRTEDNENSFLGAAPAAHLRSVASPDERESPRWRWTLRFSRERAQQLLGSTAKGRLRKIRVTKRGRSPRVVRAIVQGTRGSVRVTGPELRRRLGLFDTWARFSLATTRATPTRAHRSLTAVLHLPRGVVSGSVAPVPRRRSVTLQRRTRSGWRTVTTSTTTRAGAYRIAVDRRGAYRTVAEGIAGPTVRVR